MKYINVPYHICPHTSLFTESASDFNVCFLVYVLYFYQTQNCKYTKLSGQHVIIKYLIVDYILY